MKNNKVGRNSPCPCGSGKKYKKCCLNSKQTDNPVQNIPEFKRDEIDILMEKGWVTLNKDQVTQACDMWLEVWEKLKIKFDPAIKDVNELDTSDIYTGSEFISNWCQDLELELGNAGLKDPVYYEKRKDFCSEFCLLFPESNLNIIHNMKRAIGESYYALGNPEEGENSFLNLIKEYPNNVWSYIAYADMYCYPLNKDTKPDYVKAKEIYSISLGKNLKDEEVVVERLSALNELVRDK